GKTNSSKNAIRHGLLAEGVVLEREKTPAFLELLNELIEEHHPSTPTQHMLVETMAVARWRLLRTWSMQKHALDRDLAMQDGDTPALQAAQAFRSTPETATSYELLLRYEVALDRQFHRALFRLRQLQGTDQITKRTQQVTENTSLGSDNSAAPQETN